jgi:hypothetical protein
MTSKLAEQTYNGWLAEGLTPSLEMCVDLNAAGVALERNSDAADFAALPRVAFLGDFILREPSVKKRVYLDELRQTLDERDDRAQIFAVAYVCYTPYADLVPLDSSVRKIRRAVAQFALEVLGDFAESQIIAALDYLLTGANPHELTNDYSDPRPSDPLALPANCRSYAKQLLEYAVAKKIDAASCGETTLASLERMVAVAAMEKNVDFLKDRAAENTARFYQVAGKCRAKMLADRAASAPSPAASAPSPAASRATARAPSSKESPAP